MTTLHQLILLGLLIGVMAFGSEARAASGTLRDAAGDRMLIGAAIMSHQLDDPNLAKLIAAQFSCPTPENEMKPDQLEPVKGQFTFDKADKIVAFAKAHGMQVVGHTLCWHHQSPA